MFVKELWRYPVKSLAGERVPKAELTLGGIVDDRKVLVVGPNGKVITSRTHHRLLALKGTIGADGAPRVSGFPWDSPEALQLGKEAAGPGASLRFYEGVDRFDVLPLLVATDGAIAHMGIDGRRLRSNIVVGGVKGLAERQWPGRRLQIGDAIVEAAQLRGRCVMTTYDPDSLRQDRGVLRRIVEELDGRMALDCAILQGATIHEGDPVRLLEE